MFMEEVAAVFQLNTVQLNAELNMFYTSFNTALNFLRIHPGHIGCKQRAERCARRAPDQQVRLLGQYSGLSLVSLTF